MLKEWGTWRRVSRAVYDGDESATADDVAGGGEVVNEVEGGEGSEEEGSEEEGSEEEGSEEEGDA